MIKKEILKNQILKKITGGWHCDKKGYLVMSKKELYTLYNLNAPETKDISGCFIEFKPYFGFNYKIYEDTECLLPCLKSTETVATRNDPFYHYVETFLGEETH